MSILNSTFHQVSLRYKTHDTLLFIIILFGVISKTSQEEFHHASRTQATDKHCIMATHTTRTNGFAYEYTVANLFELR